MCTIIYQGNLYYKSKNNAKQSKKKNAFTLKMLIFQLFSVI